MLTWTKLAQRSRSLASVVHGYFLISAAAGLFVDAGVGPVIANYGMENLRFIEPVKPGDTIRAPDLQT